MADRTRSKSSSKTNCTESDVITLSLVKELMKAQEETMKSFVQTFVENTNKKIDKLTADLKSVIDSLEFTQEEMKDLKKEVRQIAEIANGERSEQETKNCALGNKVRETDTRIKDLEAKTDDLENRSRRSNLCFDGVVEDPNESWSTSEKKIREIVGVKLNIKTDEFSIERAHRAGRRDVSGKPRTIVAKFLNYKTKEKILKNKKGLKGTNVFVREDFSQKVLAKRKELLPAMHEERRKGNIAFLRYDRLVVYPNRSGRETGSARSPQPSPFHSAGGGRGQPTWRTPVQPPLFNASQNEEP